MENTKMARKYSGVLLVRQLLANRYNLCAALLPHHNLPSIFTRPNSFQFKTLLHFLNLRFLQNRPLSSSSGAPSNIVLVKSEDELKSTLSKAQDGSLPAIFYFTAVWCGLAGLYLQSLGN